MPNNPNLCLFGICVAKIGESAFADRATDKEISFQMCSSLDGKTIYVSGNEDGVNFYNLLKVPIKLWKLCRATHTAELVETTGDVPVFTKHKLEMLDGHRLVLIKLRSLANERVSVFELDLRTSIWTCIGKISAFYQPLSPTLVDQAHNRLLTVEHQPKAGSMTVLAFDFQTRRQTVLAKVEGGVQLSPPIRVNSLALWRNKLYLFGVRRKRDTAKYPLAVLVIDIATGVATFESIRMSAGEAEHRLVSSFRRFRHEHSRQFGAKFYLNNVYEVVASVVRTRLFAVDLEKLEIQLERKFKLGDYINTMCFSAQGELIYCLNGVSYKINKFGQYQMDTIYAKLYSVWMNMPKLETLSWLALANHTRREVAEEQNVDAKDVQVTPQHFMDRCTRLHQYQVIRPEPY